MAPACNLSGQVVQTSSHIDQLLQYTDSYFQGSRRATESLHEFHFRCKVPPHSAADKKNRMQ